MALRYQARSNCKAWGGAVHGSNDQLPYRVMSRFLNEFQIRCTEHQLTVFDCDIDHHTIILLVWRVALRTESTGRISINAIASSLDRPYESVRRRVHRLVSDGWLIIDDEGVTISKSKHVLALLAGVEAVMLEKLHRMLDGFIAFDIELPPPLLFRPLTGPAVIAAAIDLQLISFEHNNAQMPNAMALNVMGAMLVLNVEDINNDHDLSMRYSRQDQVPPASARKPVSLNAVAEMLNTPYATVWRHAQVMMKSGVIARVAGGYIVSPEWLGSPGTADAAVDIIHHMRRALFALAATLKP